MCGINAIRITGRLLNKNIPIGADIALVSNMTRIFIISTIMARGKVGIKDSMASVLLEFLLVTSIVGPRLLLTSVVGPLLLLMFAVGPLLLPTSVGGPLLLLKFAVGPLLLPAAVPLPVVKARVKTEKLLLRRKSVRNSPPTVASSQIAQPGRSGIFWQILNFVRGIKVSPV